MLENKKIYFLVVKIDKLTFITFKVNTRYTEILNKIYNWSFVFCNLIFMKLYYLEKWNQVSILITKDFNIHILIEHNLKIKHLMISVSLSKLFL